MKLGLCIGMGGADKFPLLKEIGFDYVETHIIGNENRTPEEIDAWRNALDKVGLKCESSAIRFPSEYNPDGEQTKEQLEIA